MTDKAYVAIITGGASGIGLAVGNALLARGEWEVYLLDKDEEKGRAAVTDKPFTHFIQVEVTDYASLASAFAQIFKAHGKMSFVFANAGIALDNSAQAAETSSTLDPPAAPSMNMLHVNLHSVMCTSHLAQHYFRLCPADGGPRSMVITGSSAGLYASVVAPAYSASKHGVIGWTRSIAPSAWHQDQVRINAICPGIVRTNILPPEMFAMFPEHMLTPVSKVVEVVLMLVDGDGDKESGHDLLIGQAVEICGMHHYIRKQHEYCDPIMAAIMSVGG